MLHRSGHHAPPDTSMTVKILCDGLQRNYAHEEKGCRNTKEIIDHLHNSMRRIQGEKGDISEGQEKEGMNEADNDHDQRVAVEMNDLEV